MGGHSLWTRRVPGQGRALPRQPHPKRLAFFTGRALPRSRGEPALAKPRRPYARRAKPPPEPRIDLADHSLFHVNTRVKQILAAKRAGLPALRAELARALWIAENGLDGDRQRARARVVELRGNIRDLEGSYEYALYLMRTHRVLEQYKALTARETSFLGGQTRSGAVGTDGDAPSADDLAAEYLRVAREYVDVANYTRKPQRLECGGCGAAQFETDETVYACRGCGAVQEQLDDAPSFKDTNRVNMCSRYTYSRKNHFIKAMQQFQARQNKTIPARVYETLRREIRAHGLSEETTTMDHVYEFLVDNGLSAFYGDVNKLYCELTGAPPNDISHLEPKLLELFDETEDGLEQVKDPDRLNSLNVNYKLLKLLQHLHYPCRRGDFYVLKTQDKWDEHENKWEEMRVLKGWPYTPTIY